LEVVSKMEGMDEGTRFDSGELKESLEEILKRGGEQARRARAEKREAAAKELYNRIGHKVLIGAGVAAWLGISGLVLWGSVGAEGFSRITGQTARTPDAAASIASVTAAPSATEYSTIYSTIESGAESSYAVTPAAVITSKSTGIPQYIGAPPTVSTAAATTATAATSAASILKGWDDPCTNVKYHYDEQGNCRIDAPDDLRLKPYPVDGYIIYAANESEADVIALQLADQIPPGRKSKYASEYLTNPLCRVSSDPDSDDAPASAAGGSPKDGDVEMRQSSTPTAGVPK
jgi:hypothetical protein